MLIISHTWLRDSFTDWLGTTHTLLSVHGDFRRKNIAAGHYAFSQTSNPVTDQAPLHWQADFTIGIHQGSLDRLLSLFPLSLKAWLIHPAKAKLPGVARLSQPKHHKVHLASGQNSGISSRLQDSLNTGSNPRLPHRRRISIPSQ